MEKRILLNGETLNKLYNTNSLILSKKWQKKTLNYYFCPTIGLKLYNPQVSWIDPSKKNISFMFNKWENTSLLKLLQFIHDTLTTIYNDSAYSTPSTLAPFFYEKDDKFYIRTYLPQVKGHYGIKSTFDNITGPFYIPRKDCTYNSIIIDFRNIWESDNRAGYNIELKETFTTVE